VKCNVKNKKRHIKDCQEMCSDIYVTKIALVLKKKRKKERKKRIKIVRVAEHIISIYDKIK